MSKLNDMGRALNYKNIGVALLGSEITRSGDTVTITLSNDRIGQIFERMLTRCADQAAAESEADELIRSAIKRIGSLEDSPEKPIQTTIAPPVRQGPQLS